MFDRKSAESMISDMITWTQGVTTKVTDFRVGSRIRTLMEAIALVMEERVDKLFRSLREMIESNIYAVFGFDKIPATYATGTARFSRTSSADQNYYIPAGTTVMSQASQYNAPMRFYTTQDAVLAIGTTYVDVTVICDTSGIIGNIDAGTLTSFVSQPLGVETVTNQSAFATGADEETSEAQKARFQAFMQAQSRGVLQSIVYGAQQAKLTDSTTGLTTEAVYQAVAIEDLVNKLGQVDLYIWNGVGTASASLISAVNQKLTGYYDTSGNPVYGYKPAGILVNIYSASIKYVTIKLTVTPETWTTLANVQPSILAEVTRYFGALNMGQTVVQSALQANIKNIDGVYDVKLQLSTDNGSTYSTNNVTVTSTQMAVAKLPIIYG